MSLASTISLGQEVVLVWADATAHAVVHLLVAMFLRRLMKAHAVPILKSNDLKRPAGPSAIGARSSMHQPAPQMFTVCVSGLKAAVPRKLRWGWAEKGPFVVKAMVLLATFAALDVVERIEGVMSVLVTVNDLVLVAVEEDEDEEELLELLVVEDVVDMLLVDVLVSEVDVVVLFVLDTVAVVVGVVVLVDVTVDVMVLVDVIVDVVVLVDVTVDVVVFVEVTV
eukprot:CAMPEP_0172887430 /NCGR_PEP_ID=MMETSP1075-20121228/133932_1 /TAXON_ID=2916 /ORGANISM="Ceratium fusus, Strain PA161109" /LENGTH=223 /DNA_ID=CAMNT_0013741117 /DNA_START=72 /DNA_END=745 /DNA_ORIENTATION=+